MKNLLAISTLCFFIAGCSSIPRNSFTYPYTGEYTGLDKLINTKGCYLSYNCDSSQYVMTVFYTNGLMSNISTVKKSDNSFLDINNTLDFYKVKKPDWLSWGNYIIKDDIIKVQTYVSLGIQGKYIENSEYKILSEGRIQLISKYVKSNDWNPKWYLTPDCNKPAVFVSLPVKADSTKCPLLKKKWFWTKEAWKGRNK